MRGLQVDFDATVSERAFYADVMRQVRARLPAGDRLEMTALVSWYSQNDGWMHGLPVDAAVPMDFALAVMWVRGAFANRSVPEASESPPTSRNHPSSCDPGESPMSLHPDHGTPGQLAEINEGRIPQERRGSR